MKTKILLLIVCMMACLALRVQAQEPPQVWSLEQCITYAQQNNIGVQQQELSIHEGEIQLSTARNSRLPDLNASLGADMYFGRSPSRDGIYTDNSQLSGALGVSTSVPVFQGFRINRQIKGAKLDLDAAVQDMLRAREDVAVSVMTLYLEVLFNKELLAVARQQLALSTEQTLRTRELVAMGRQPESALYESEALQANDELNLAQSQNDLTLSLLSLSQALNRPSAAGFDVQTPRIDSLTIESLYRLGSPDDVYAYADDNRPVIRAERVKLASREAAVRTARAALAPSIVFSAGYGTNLYRSFDSGEINPSFWSQFRNNGKEYLSLSVNIPIFNRRATRNNIRSARLAVSSQELALTEAQQNLRKEIERAYYKANAAYVKYRASDKALASAQVAFTAMEQKAAAGRATVFDYNDARMRMEKAESEMIRAKYEFVFTSKVLDFYMGRRLIL